MKRLPTFIFISIIIAIVSWFIFLLSRVNIQLFNPKGIIAGQQSNLILTAFAIMLPIALTVVIIGLITIWRFREGNSKSKRDLNHKGNKFTIFVYYAFLAELVLIFFFIVFVNSHKLDPYKPIVSTNEPINVEVITLRWKWLFIYPEENIASVNFLQIPVNTPVRFRLTSDGPMNSFWIPSLGGQIYSMTGMATQINLMGNTLGDFKGEAAEINGEGFSGMRFNTRVSTQKDYEDWVSSVRESDNPLSNEAFESLSKPSENVPVSYYSSVVPNLFDDLVTGYMTHDNSEENQDSEGH